MAHQKYQALADRIKKRRLEQINQIHPTKTQAVPYLARVQKDFHAKQIPLPFSGSTRTLEIFHQFDPKGRSIEWSFYTHEGEFLLQFSFCLERQAYEVHAVHPDLFKEQSPLQAYRQAIEENLETHHPPLSLIQERANPVPFGSRK